MHASSGKLFMCSLKEVGNLLFALMIQYQGHVVNCSNIFFIPNQSCLTKMKTPPYVIFRNSRTPRLSCYSAVITLTYIGVSSFCIQCFPNLASLPCPCTGHIFEGQQPEPAILTHMHSHHWVSLSIPSTQAQLSVVAKNIPAGWRTGRGEFSYPSKNPQCSGRIRLVTSALEKSTALPVWLFQWEL